MLGCLKVWLLILCFLLYIFFIILVFSCVFLLSIKKVVFIWFFFNIFKIFGVYFGFGLLLNVNIICFLFGFLYCCILYVDGKDWYILFVR